MKGRIWDQHIITCVGLTDDVGDLHSSLFTLAAARVGDLSIEYVDDYSVKIFASCIPDRILVEGAIVFETDRILCSAAVGLADSIAAESRSRRQDCE